LKFLFIVIPEIKVKIGHRSTPSIAQGYNIFYDRGAEIMVLVGHAGKVEEGQTTGHFFLTQLNNEMIRDRRVAKVKNYTRFPCTHKKEPADFH